MKIWVLIIILSFGFGYSSFADTQYLRDVPEGHYAYDAVYDLIKQGITGGYPDGTFRGKQFMNRYEIASFISKFAKFFNMEQGKNEKLVEELKSEVLLLGHERRKWNASGGLQARWRANRTDYRLRAKVVRSFGEGADLKINLDTMDAGYGGGSSDLALKLLDIEGKAKIGAAVLKVVSGPGDVARVEDGFFPGENRMKYRRPRRSVSLSSAPGMTELSIEHLTHSSASSGMIGAEEVSVRIARNFYPFKATANPRIFGSRDNRLDLLAEYYSNSILVGIAKTNNYPNGLFIRGELTFSDWAKVLVQKVGAQYREKFSYNLFDAFDRDLPDGSASLGLELNNPFSETWIVKLKGDYTRPGEAVTAEIDLGWRMSRSSALKLVYQSYSSQAQSFSRAIGFMAEVNL